MEEPSVASSNAHLPQPFDRRNEPVPHGSAYNNSETRQKIVEILASTANGCLAELGYFPGMPQKLRELELQNKNWQTENVKLFEDNKRLMGMLNAQNESLKWVKVPDMEKIQRIKDLEQENQALRIEREELLRRSIAEGGQPLQQGQISYEHSNLLDTYRLAYNEVQRLRAYIAQNQQEPIRISQYHPTPPQNLPQFPMPVASQVLHPPHQAPVQQVQAPQQATVTNLQPTMQERRRDLAQIQNPVVQRRQQQTVPMSRRSTSGTIIIPPRAKHPAKTQSAQSPIQPTPQSMLMQGETPLTPMENTIRASKRGGNAYPNILPSQPASRSSSSPASAIRSAPSPPIRSPLSIQPADAQFHPAPTGAPNTHPQGPPPASSVRSPSTPSSVVPTPTSAESSVASMTTLTRPSYDTQLPGLTPPLPSPAINSPRNLAGPSNQSGPSSTHTPVPPPAASLKRDSISDQDVAELAEEPNKKPRLEDSYLEPTATEPTAGPSSVPLPEPPTEVPAPVSGVQEAMQVDGEEEHEGSEDELIELGPDGLRLVKDCLSEIFHEPKEDGSVICKLCEYRHTHGYQEEPPVQFVNPTEQQLEDHCVTEHEAAWSNLRNPDAE